MKTSILEPSTGIRTLLQPPRDSVALSPGKSHYLPLFLPLQHYLLTFTMIVTNLLGTSVLLFAASSIAAPQRDTGTLGIPFPQFANRLALGNKATTPDAIGKGNELSTPESFAPGGKPTTPDAFPNSQGLFGLNQVDSFTPGDRVTNPDNFGSSPGAFGLGQGLQNLENPGLSGPTGSGGVVGSTKSRPDITGNTGSQLIASRGGCGLARCSGEASYYTYRPPAPLWCDGQKVIRTHDSRYESVVALSASTRNLRALCGKKLIVTWKGKTHAITIADKCPGCVSSFIVPDRRIVSRFEADGFI